MEYISNKLLKGAGSYGPIGLMYHSISTKEKNPRSPWVVSFDDFRKQLDLLCDNNWKSIRIKDLSILGHQKKTVVITFDDGYEDNYRAYEALVERNMLATWFVVTKDIGRMSSWSDDDMESKKLFDKDTLKELFDNGMEIGSHTCTHSRLVELNKKELKNELFESKKVLENIIKNSVESFAYPYGLYNNESIKILHDAEYKYACSTRSGWILAEKNNYLLRRVTIFNDDSVSTFSRKLAFQDNKVDIPTLAKYYSNRLIKRILE